MQPLCNLPCGVSLPTNNPHAVSVNLPTMAAIRGYEEGDESILATMQSGYPRFFTNKLVQKLTAYVREKNNIPDDKILLPITSNKAKNILEDLLEIKLDYLEEDESFFVIFDQNDSGLIKACKSYIQNIGLVISSRKAESTLFKLGLVDKIFDETKSKSTDPESEIQNALASAYDIASDEVLIANSGMNAVFAAVETAIKFGQLRYRNTVVQLGWLYLDTNEIIERRSGKTHLQIEVGDKKSFEKWLSANHSDTAAIVTEAVTNPTLRCVDLPWLYTLCRQYDICLIVDSTIATPYNINVIRFCDIAVESLTKFASGGGDVMMGAVILNSNSRFIDYKNDCFDRIIPAFKGELQRMAFQVQDYESRIVKVAANTRLLYKYLKEQPFVKKVHSVFCDEEIECFKKISKSADSIPGLLTVIFDKKLDCYYDRLDLPKGPTLGTEFTIAMPYVYLAHYDLLRSQSGRAKLEKLGLHPELLRISVGIEPIEDIIAVFEALKQPQTAHSIVEVGSLAQ